MAVRLSLAAVSIATAGLVIWFALPGGGPTPGGDADHAATGVGEPSARPERQWTVGPYRIELGNGPDGDQALHILRDGQVMEGLSDQTLDLLEPVGANVTGGEAPQIVAQGWSGGAHCCFSATVFELGDGVRVVATIEGDHAEPQFLQADADPALEVVVQDGTYAYWPGGFAGSASPDVVLKFAEGGWRFAAALMRRPAPSDQALAALAAEARQYPQWGRGVIPRELWQRALGLAYSGQLEAAERFFRMAWPKGRPDRDEWSRALFGCRLRMSPWWPDIAALNRVVAAAPVGECAGAE